MPGRRSQRRRTPAKLTGNLRFGAECAETNSRWVRGTRRCLVRGVGESFPDRSQVGRQPAPASAEATAWQARPPCHGGSPKGEDGYQCHYRGRGYRVCAPWGAQTQSRRRASARQAAVQGGCPAEGSGGEQPPGRVWGAAPSRVRGSRSRKRARASRRRGRYRAPSNSSLPLREFRKSRYS